MPEDRRAIHAYLSPDGHEDWHKVSQDAGVSVSGLLEALAADMAANPPDQGGHPRWDELVRAARSIDAQRRRRNRAVVAAAASSGADLAEEPLSI